MLVNNKLKIPLKILCLYHTFLQILYYHYFAAAPYDMAVVNSEKDLHQMYDGLPCPRCPREKGSKVETTIFGKGAFIRICSDCGWCVGVDDSVNLCDLGSERWIFK